MDSKKPTKRRGRKKLRGSKYRQSKGFGWARVDKRIPDNDNLFVAASEGDRITLKDGREGILLLFWYRSRTSFLFSYEDKVVLIRSILEIAKAEEEDINQWLVYDRILTDDI